MKKNSKKRAIESLILFGEYGHGGAATKTRSRVAEEKKLEEYYGEFKKAKETEQYKVTEKYSSLLGFDIKNQKSFDYWTIKSEAIMFFGRASFFESRKTLKTRKNPSDRPSFMNHALPDYLRKDLLKIFPKKCGRCGFWRFFEIKVTYNSVGPFAEIVCPNCERKLGEAESNP